MKTVMKSAAVIAAMAGAVAARRALASRAGGQWPIARPEREPRQQWHVITINRGMPDVAPDGRLPEPVARLGDAVEVQVRPAPGDKGTELAVRLRRGEPAGFGDVAARLSGHDPRYAVRAALREAKQLVETGEVLSPDKMATAKRTLLNRPLEYATRHGREEGRL